MKYPFGFTEDLQRPVETARDRAELVWREAMSAKRGHPEALARDFVAQVFREFARQACEAERRGIWSAAESRKHVEWFLEWELIPHVYDVTDIRRFYRLVGGFQASVLQRMNVPHPVPWTHICAMPPGVAHTPRAPRSAFDTQASRDARSGCTAPRRRPRRRGRPRGSERFGRGSLAP